ncbi:MAG: outer membrane protein assembly factor BamD, partial [Desulfobulbus propionicus]
ETNINRIQKSLWILALVLLLGFSMTGCSTIGGMYNKVFGDEQEEDPGESPEMLISEGMSAYGVGNYPKAIEAFEEILDNHPFSKQAMLAELKAADAHYYNESYIEAKLLYEEFEERHPTNEAIPYVLFQMGMCDFAQTDRIDRDTSGADDSIRTFSRLLRTYPDSPYTKEAQARIRAAKEFLVNHEYHVAVFYVRTKKYEQAKHRLKSLITMYPESVLLPKAKTLLKRLEKGTPPKWGLSKWLPESLALPSWQ